MFFFLTMSDPSHVNIDQDPNSRCLVEDMADEFCLVEWGSDANRPTTRTCADMHLKKLSDTFFALRLYFYEKHGWIHGYLSRVWVGRGS